MRVKTLSTLCIVTSILFIMAVAAEVFVDGLMRPASLFGYLAVTTFITGIVASAVVERIDTIAA